MLCIFLTLDIGGMNDIRLISGPFHAPSLQLENIDSNTLLTKLVRGFWLSYWEIEKSVFTLFMGYEPISLFYLTFLRWNFPLIKFVVWCMVAFDAWCWEFGSVRFNRRSLYLHVYPITVVLYSDSSLFSVCYFVCNLFLLGRLYGLLFVLLLHCV